MKINVEFDLEWVDDEDTIDGAVSRKIISMAVEQIGEKIITAIKNSVDEKMNAKVDDFLNDVLSGFMDRNIIITDKWGKEVARHETVNNLLETRFDEFITESVDKDGKTSRERGCRIDGVPRIDYMATRHIDTKMKELTVSITKEIDQYFKEKIVEAKASIHKATIENYMNRIDFDAGLKE